MRSLLSALSLPAPLTLYIESFYCINHLIPPSPFLILYLFSFQLWVHIQRYFCYFIFLEGWDLQLRGEISLLVQVTHLFSRSRPKQNPQKRKTGISRAHTTNDRHRTQNPRLLNR
jgi:hypothetical protein